MSVRDEIMSDPEMFGDVIGDLFNSDFFTEDYNKNMLRLFKAVSAWDNDATIKAAQELHAIMELQIQKAEKQEKQEEQEDDTENGHKPSASIGSDAHHAQWSATVTGGGY